MIGKIFITRSGYDPQLGRHVKDPYLGDIPSIGACRPDFRKLLTKGDHLFVISGKIQGISQFVMGGFEVAEKMSAMQAYWKFPEQRLRLRADGQVTGNIIVDANGKQHELDDHRNFYYRSKNYIVGRNPIALRSNAEIYRGRKQTLEVLQEILRKKGKFPFDLVGREGMELNEQQILELRNWLTSLQDN